ncbi:MAG: DUF1501 domain-containing protein [Planctomycetes bacterium]|nr:DUF1501 domain-containing protein [Planctomycetota bacterium]
MAVYAAQRLDGYLLYLWGGPPQQDMWDMKPDAPEGIRSLFQPIQTNVPGIQLCDHLPMLARHADKLALVRSVTHPSNVHEPSVYRTLTGQVNNTLVVPRNQRSRRDFPNFPAMVSALTPPGAMPTSVTIPRPIGHGGVTYAGTYSGWLGPRHDPMEIREAPSARDRYAAPVELPADLPTTRLQARRGLLNLIEQSERHFQNSRATDGLSAFHEQAYRMLTSSQARRAFQVDQEPAWLRDRYGRNEYGESFLLARRLIEAEVRLVSVIWLYVAPSGTVSNVWDTHGGVGIPHGQTGWSMLRAPYCLPPLDQAYSALLEDLHQRGLLDDTLVVAMGEFGRTPRINPNQGREHWGPCYTVAFSGGGVRGGQVYGRSDRLAAYPTENPVSPEDVLATMYHALGIRPDAEVHDREGRPVRICDGQPITAVF